MGALAGRMAGIGTIVTSRRALGTHQDRHRWWTLFDRVANRYSTLITANSQAVIVDTVQRDHVNPAKMRLIYNGLNLQAAQNVAEDRKVIRQGFGLKSDDVALVFVANLIEYKGHRELIDAFSRIHSTHPFVHLFLIGEDRGIGRSLREFAESLGVAPWVNFLGRRSDVKKLLAAMDLGVMASHEEGFSNALLEKLAAGLPVLATDVGGNPEALAGVPDCMMVSARSPDDMAHGLLTMISKLDDSRIHGDQRSMMIRNRYSIESMVEKHVMLYDEVQKGD
jgi:glycosyltransferase involved in cell wall biosynthesis